jgi:hypothetical protein
LNDFIKRALTKKSSSYNCSLIRFLPTFNALRVKYYKLKRENFTLNNGRESPCLQSGHGGGHPLAKLALQEGVVVTQLRVAVAGKDLHTTLITTRPLLVTPGPHLATPAQG